MIPIFEQGQGKGIGHGFGTFVKRFDEICRMNSERAFAFIFYDFRDQVLKRILQDQGVFAKLDRLSGTELTIFYLHSGGNHVRRFNTIFKKAIGVEDAPLPCVAFFRWTKGGFTDVSVVPLESGDIIHAFHELFEVVAAYKDGKPPDNRMLKYLRWIPSAFRVISIEALKAALKAAFDRLPM